MNELKKRQTPESVNDSYSLGFAVVADWIGHGEAQATNLEIRYGKGFVTIWMVQLGGYPGDGSKAQGAFKQWTYQQFGKP